MVSQMEDNHSRSEILVVDQEMSKKWMIYNGKSY